VRVAAHKAKHVIVMMTEKDEQESAANPGCAPNSATTRTVLALRNIIYSTKSQPFEETVSSTRLGVWIFSWK
jgi:hypothetical protein